MEKYKSSFIQEEDIKIETDHYYKGNVRYDTVRITHIRGNFTTIAKGHGQLKTYNIALEKLEDKIKQIINSQF